MGLRYNPFTGSFDFTRSPGSYLDGEVATFADLPLDTAAAPLNSAWLVREASGLWLLGRKPAGIYIRSAAGGTDRDADYTYAGTFPDVFSDANFVVYNDADSTKNVKFSAANLTTGTTRTLTVPDASGTLPLLESANTFTQNQTLDGTNNVAPNQTAASGSSLITRDLGDERYPQNIRTLVYDFGSGHSWTQIVTGTASISARGNTLQIDSANATAFGAVTAYVANERAVIGEAATINFSEIQFNAPLQINIRLRSRVFNTANTSWGFSSGGFGFAAGLANLFDNTVNRRLVGLECVGGNVVIVVQNGTSTLARSATVDTWNSGDNTKGYVLRINSGVFSLYNSSGTLLGSMTGAPTAALAHTVAFCAESSAAHLAQTGIIVQHLSFNW
jgi:hypothetical protein